MIVSLSLGLVLLIPVWVLCILPLDVAGGLANKLRTSFRFMNGNPSRKLLLMVFMDVVIGGLTALQLPTIVYISRERWLIHVAAERALMLVDIILSIPVSF